MGCYFGPYKPLVMFILVLTILVLFGMYDGDLLLFIDRMLHQRGSDTVCVSKVKGHADEDKVLHGRVRREDKLGNDAPDEAADFGRRRVSPAVIDARRNLSGVCSRWYPVILDLHRFYIAIARAVVNHDGLGGTAPDPLVWSAGALRKRRRLVFAVRDRAFLPGPPWVWCSVWCQVPSAVISCADVDLWPFSPGLLVKWVSFLNSLHWPVGDLDLGVGGISYVELLILYKLWAGERLRLENLVQFSIEFGQEAVGGSTATTRARKRHATRDTQCEQQGRCSPERDCGRRVVNTETGGEMKAW